MKSILVLAALILTIPESSPAAAAAVPDARAREVTALLAATYAPHSPGAAVGVVRDGKVLLATAAGLANVEEKTSATSSTNFRLASVTKQFTAMAILLLAERKQLSLEDNLLTFFPEFPEYDRQVTVRQLIQHTSGLLDYEDFVTTDSLPVLDRDALWLLEQQNTTLFPPGTRFKYSNSGYAVLAVIVEKVSGQTFAAFMKKNIFEPLGMKNTLLNERGISVIPNRAYGYAAKDGAFERADQSSTSYVLGDGGIYSSVDDLIKWHNALDNAKLVSPETMKQVFTAGPATMHGDKKDIGYGFGWFIGTNLDQPCHYHSGGTRGFTNRVERFPEKNLTVILLTNRQSDTATSTTVPNLATKIAETYIKD